MLKKEENKEEGAFIGSQTSYWSLEGDVSSGFNRLKAKLYNLIDATIIDINQREAVKGLIKGFANDEFKLCVSNMKYNARLLKILGEGEDSFSGAEPLEVSER